MLLTMRKFKISLAILLLASSFGVTADPFSQVDLNWLKKMTVATRQQNYSGTFIYQSGGYVETSRITHVLDGVNEYERVEGLDGERSEIIRKNDQIWCYLGDSEVLVAKRGRVRTFPALLPEQFELLQENYHVSEGEEDRVAGFQAHSIIFHPRDRMRYIHKMWMHSDSGLLLKVVVQDEHEHIIEQYAFTQMDIGGDIDRKWIQQEKLTSPKEQFIPASVASQDFRPIPAGSGWKVQAIPAGFKKIAEVSRRLKGSDLPVTHLVYSDGLAGISVFIEKLGEKSSVKRELYSKGVIHIFTKPLSGYLLTVVGEVPPRTVIQVGDSVRFAGEK